MPTIAITSCLYKAGTVRPGSTSMPYTTGWQYASKQKLQVESLLIDSAIRWSWYNVPEGWLWWCHHRGTSMIWRDDLSKFANVPVAPATPYLKRLDRSLSRGIAKRTMRDSDQTQETLIARLLTLEKIVDLSQATSRGQMRRAIHKKRTKLRRAIERIVLPQVLMDPAEFQIAEDEKQWLTVWPLLCTANPTAVRDGWKERAFKLVLLSLGTMDGFHLDRRIVQMCDIGFYVRQHAVERAAQRLGMTEHDSLIKVFGPTLMCMFLMAYIDGKYGLPTGTGTCSGGDQCAVPIGTDGAAVVELATIEGRYKLIVHTILRADQLTVAQRSEMMWWRDMCTGNAECIAALMAQCVMDQLDPHFTGIINSIDHWVDENKLRLWK